MGGFPRNFNYDAFGTGAIELAASVDEARMQSWVGCRGSKIPPVHAPTSGYGPRGASGTYDMETAPFNRLTRAYHLRLWASSQKANIRKKKWRRMGKILLDEARGGAEAGRRAS